jgi:hypothetical protein
MEKSPYLFDPVKWRTSLWPLKLTYAEQGIFRSLEDTCWIDGGIPSDLSMLRIQIGIPQSKFDELWPKISGEFIECDGRLIMPVREADRQRLLSVRTARAEAGKKGGEANAKQLLSKAKAKLKLSQSKNKPVPVPVSVPVPGSKGEQGKDAPPALLFGVEFGAVHLSSEEHVKLVEKLGSSQTAELIDDLDRYSRTNPKKFAQYSSHYAVILTWARKRADENPPAISRRPTGVVL